MPHLKSKMQVSLRVRQIIDPTKDFSSSGAHREMLGSVKNLILVLLHLTQDNGVVIPHLTQDDGVQDNGVVILLLRLIQDPGTAFLGLAHNGMVLHQTHNEKLL